MIHLQKPKEEYKNNETKNKKTWRFGDFEDLTRRKASDEILGGKVFTIAKNLKYGDQR